MNAMPADIARRAPFDTGTAFVIALTLIGWASAFPAIRAGLAGFGPIELAAGRFAIAALPAIAYFAIARPVLPAGREWWRMISGGVFSVAVYSVLLNIGELTVPAGVASFIVNTNIVMTALLAIPLLGERFGPLAWLGTFVSVVGVAMIAMGDTAQISLDVGVLFILAAALCSAVSTVVQKPLYVRHRPLSVASWNMLIGGLFLMPALPSALREAQVASSGALWAMLYLALIPGALAYATWSMTLSRMSAARASNFLYCVPPIATLIGYLWLGERPSPLGILGGCIALVGVVIVNLRRRA